MLEPMMGPFADALRQVTFKEPRSGWLSNVTGTWVTPAEAMSPDYWLSHLRKPVNFADGISEALRNPNWVLLEVGPGQTLGSLARRQGAFTDQHIILASARHPKEAPSDVAYLMETVGRLWLAGVTLDWPGLHAKQRRRRVPLPTYPFERKRHWVDAVSSAWALPDAARHRETHAAVKEQDLSIPQDGLGDASPPPETAASALTTTRPGTVQATSELPAAPPPTALSSLMAEQLRVLSLQLEVLRQSRSR
jgi:acyl transferase domain-containing protein